LAACQQFLARRPDAPAEAHEVVAAWEEVLDALEQLQLSGDLPPSLIGTVDWVTKKQLLDEAGRNTSWEARKKIDICYHELSPLGYFQMLQAAGLAASFASPQELERAVRTPPANSPATMRGHYIREFSSDEEELSVNWKYVVIGRGFGSKSIRLARYDRPARVVSDQPQLGTHDPDRSNTQ
jgi:proteasome accessory factor A